jgi:hypothetical protein
MYTSLDTEAENVSSFLKITSFYGRMPDECFPCVLVLPSFQFVPCLIHLHMVVGSRDRYYASRMNFRQLCFRTTWDGTTLREDRIRQPATGERGKCIFNLWRGKEHERRSMHLLPPRRKSRTCPHGNQAQLERLSMSDYRLVLTPDCTVHKK